MECFKIEFFSEFLLSFIAHSLVASSSPSTSKHGQRTGSVLTCLHQRTSSAREYQLAVLSYQRRKSVGPRFRLREIRIVVRVRRRAAAEKAQWFCSHDGVPRAWRDEDRIASPDLATFTVELYLARAFEDEIKLLRHLVIVPLCPAACGDARFRKALVLYRRIRAIEDRTDSRAVLGDKRRLGREILDGHTF